MVDDKGNDQSFIAVNSEGLGMMAESILVNYGLDECLIYIENVFKTIREILPTTEEALKQKGKEVDIKLKEKMKELAKAKANGTNN